MNKNFIFLYSGHTFSLFSFTLYKISIPLLIYEITKSPINMAFTFSLSFIPYLIFGPIGGAIADTFDKRKCLIIGNLVSFILALFLTLFIILESKNIYLIYILLFLISSVPTIYHPIFQSFIPNLVPKKDLSKANALISSAESFMSALGPIISGGIVAFISIKAAIFMSAFALLVSFASVAFISIKKINSYSKRIYLSGITKDIFDGFRFTINHKVIFYCSIIFIFFNFAITLFFSNYIYFLKEKFMASPFEIGISFSIIGSLGILGAYVGKKLIDKFHYGNIILTSSFLQIIIFLNIYYMRSNQYLFISILWGIIVFLSTSYGIAYFTMRQLIVSEKYLGRVIASTRLISYSFIPIASILGGYLVENNVSYYNLAGIGAIIMFVGTFIGFLSPIKHAKNLQIENRVS